MSDGSVVGWGKWTSTTGTDWDDPSTLPSAITDPAEGKEVLEIAARDRGGVARLADDSIVVWGGLPESNDVPDLGGKKPVALGAGVSGGAWLVLDEDGVFHADIGSGRWPPAVPLPVVEDGAVAQFQVGRPAGTNAVMIVTRMLRAEVPRVSGTAQAGSGVLTGQPGTFSAEPEQVSSQWRVGGKDGEPVGEPVLGEEPGSLSLAGYPAGTRIAYCSTATKTGEEPVNSCSDDVTVAAAPKPPMATPAVTIKVTKAPTWKKKGKATITVKGGAVASGTVTVTATGKIKKAKKGKKKAKKKTKAFAVAGVVRNGTASVKIKKIKNAKGKWTLSAAYTGDATHHPAVSRPVKIKIKKK